MKKTAKISFGLLGLLGGLILLGTAGASDLGDISISQAGLQVIGGFVCLLLSRMGYKRTKQLRQKEVVRMRVRGVAFIEATKQYGETA